jgi:hypothetical protein
MKKASRIIGALSVDATLDTLDGLLFHDAHGKFSEILCEIRESSISVKHQELKEKILENAKGLRMLGGVEVDTTLAHVERERERCKRERGFPPASSGLGHATRVHVLLGQT